MNLLIQHLLFGLRKRFPDLNPFTVKSLKMQKGVPYQLRFGSEFGTGSYVFIGAGIDKLVGIDRDQLTHERFHELIQEVHVTDQDAPQDVNECYEIFHEGKLGRYQADLLIRTPEGKMKWLSDCSLPLIDQDTGKVIGSLGILHDITERKTAENRIRESEVNYRAIFNSANDAFFVHDKETGRILEVNEKMCQMYGYTYDEVLQLTDVQDLSSGVPPYSQKERL